MRFVRAAGALACALVLLAGDSTARLAAQRAAALDPSLLGTLRWRSIGPANTGGRVDDFAVARVPGQPDAIYVATASGGLFKSTNQGTSWTPIFDRADAMMSIGAVAVAPSNPNIVWAGTGEANNRQSSSWGDGVYKSIDAGATWHATGLADTRHIGRIVAHPTNPDIAFVAAVGHLWGSNADRGVFKTADGGKTWQKVLYVDDHTGAIDLVIDPQDPQTLFAAMYQRQRRAWGFNGGGAGSGIFRSRDGGATWSKLTNGLPSGDKGRIGLDIFRGDSRLIFAIVEAPGRDSGVYRSADGGDTWEAWSSLNPRPMYYSQIRTDPRDRNRVYLLGSNRGFYISDDGGRTFRDVFSTVHSEDHALWIDPDDPNHLLVGGDGGVSVSWDRGATWMFRDNLPIGQFYEIGVDMKEPYTVCGGLQDNGHWCIPSATRNRNGISNQEGFNIGSGDGFYARIDPKDPQTVIIESQGGRANRVNMVTLEHQAIAPVGSEKPIRRGGGGGSEGDDGNLRWNWNTPIVMATADPATLYMGANMLFRSADRGVTWKAISPDLTAHIDRSKLLMMGQPITDRTLSRNDGQSNYGTLTTIGESPLDPNLLYTGSDDGQVQITRDGGAHWTNITARVPGLPPNTYVSSLLPSHFVAGRVYATFDGHFNDDYRPYVYASEDFGQTWKPIVSGLPETGTHRLREDLTNPRLLFLGHEKGLHLSIDAGATWVAMNAGMPNVPVDDLLIHPRDHDLVIGTHGRSIWIVDDIGPLEAMNAEVLSSAASLLPSPRAQLLKIYNRQAWYGAGQYFAPNPDFGGVITYYLRDAASADVNIEIQDPSGAVVRTLTGPGKRGLNRVSWDLRLAPPVAEERDAPAVGGFGGAPTGPEVLPGKYAVVLKTAAAPRPLTTSLTIEGDPRVTFADADRRTRQKALLDLYELEKSLGVARASARALSAQLATVKRDLAPAGPGHRTTPAAGSAPIDKLSAAAAEAQGDIERQLTAASQLSRAIEGYSALPTTDQRREVEWVYEDATTAIRTLDQLLERDLPGLYSQLAQQQLWPPRVQPVPPPVRKPSDK